MNILISRIIFINDIDEGVVSKLLKFADDTKLVGKVCNKWDVEILQADLNRLFEWSEEWKMLFNVEKCSVMHLGFNNSKEELKLGGRILKHG